MQTKPVPPEPTTMGDDTISIKTKQANGFNATRVAVRISALYFLVGALWVLLSDRFITNIITNVHLALIVSLTKGWVYVLITSAMLYFLIKVSITKNQAVTLKLKNKYNELAEVHEKLTTSKEKLQKHIELLTISEEKYRIISNAINDGIWNYENGEKMFSERWFEITGYAKDDIEQLNDWVRLIHPDDVKSVLAVLEKEKVNQDSTFRCEFRLRCKDGNYIWVLATTRMIFDKNGKIIRGAGSHTDISDLKRYQQQLKKLAYEDYLTKLPNRTAFYEMAKTHLKKCPDGEKAMMFIDIDNFKYINDTLGHTNGDKLIVAIGRRLLGLLGEDKSIYRIGGDEFIVFFHQYRDVDEIVRFAQGLLQEFDSAFTISGCVLNITVSLGIALYPLHGDTVDALMKCADMAMYKAKSSRHGEYAFYNEAMDIKMKERMSLENELHQALKRKEFSLHYQPQMDVATGKVTSMEALLRWKNDTLGMVSPEKFIAIAEETNLINPIGDWVLQNACSFLKKLHTQGFSDMSVSINVSILQLMQQNFTEKFMQALSQADIAPQYIMLEITESILVESYAEIKDKLMELKSKGVKIALDDFGKGYSNLIHLANIPINELKIDKLFIDTIEDTHSEMSLASMIIMLGHKMGLSIVAEGVETETQLLYLKKHHCQRIQGFYFCKPLPQDEVLHFLGCLAAPVASHKAHRGGAC